MLSEMISFGSMSDVLVRGVPDDELAELKSAAAMAKLSLQTYLRQAVVHDHVVHLRRLRALERSGSRLADRSPVPLVARDAALDGAADELERTAR